MRFSVPDDPIIAVAKVLPKGSVQLPPEVRQKLGLDPGRVNVHGGAISIGHPLGATGDG